MNPADSTGHRGFPAGTAALTGTGLMTTAHGESADVQRTAT